MHKEILPTLLYAAPFALVGLWIGMGALMAWQSGWYDLARRFPDRTDPGVETFKFRSGWFKAGIAFNGILKFEVCRTGLRVSVIRIFGPFSKNFFVPWDEITVTRGQQWLRPAARLQLADAGSLSLLASLADALARAAGDRWPETGPVPPANATSITRGILTEWAVYTAIGAALLVVVPHVLSPRGPWPPPPFVIGVPAVFSGIGALIEFMLRGGRERRALMKQRAAREVDVSPPES